MTELDPPERRTHIGGNNGVYHTDARCPSYKSAKQTRPVHPSHMGHLDECKWCAGDVAEAGARAGNREHILAALTADPEALDES